MIDKFLQEFLKTGLFDIGESDERLNWLKNSISDLYEIFKKDYSLLPKYTLVSLDPNISDTEPVLIETENIITKHWEALRVRFTEMPRPVIRGVILNALNNVGTDDSLAARIIHLTALNFFPYAKLNREKKLVEEMLNSLGGIAEKNALEEWSLIEEEPALKLGTLKVSGLKFGSVEFKTDSLKETIKQSINQTPSGHNFQHGANSPFGEKFSSEMTAGIAEFIKQCFDSYSNTISPDSIENPINKFFTEFKKTLDKNLKSSFSSLAAVERRSKLLWWKETLYSSSQKRSYRGLDKNLLPILMGLDLNNQIPEITPISVDFLLRDTLYLLIDKQDSGFKFSDYLTGISNVKLKAILKTCFDNPVETEGRISITDFIALLVNDRINIKDFKTRTGINESEQITLVELSVIVLHDLLTQRLIAE